MEGGFELGIAVGAEGGPVGGRFETFAVRGAEPELHRDMAFADVGMGLQDKAFVELDL